MMSYTAKQILWSEVEKMLRDLDGVKAYVDEKTPEYIIVEVKGKKALISYDSRQVYDFIRGMWWYWKGMVR